MPDESTPILHKCTDCGLLGVRNIKTRELLEAERNEKGEVQLEPFIESNWDREQQKFLPIYEFWPICPVRNWRALMPQQYVPGGLAGAVPDAIGSLRAWVMDYSPMHEEWDNSACFVQHVQGFTPKEHREMVDRDALRQREHDWRQDDLKLLNDTAKSTTLAAWAQAATVVVAVVGILVAVIIQDSGGDRTTNYYGVQPTPAVVVTLTPESP